MRNGLSKVPNGLRRGHGAPRLRGLLRHFGATVSGGNAVRHGGLDHTPVCDSILMTRLRIGTVAKIKDDAKASLIHALKTEELFVKPVKEDFCVGNSRGLDLVNLSQRLDTQLAAMHKAITSQKESSEKKIAALEKEITAQKAASTEAITRQKESSKKKLSPWGRR